MGPIGAMLVFAVALRLNVCVARWWEGRCLWGKLVFAAINATQQAHAAIKDEKLLRRFTNTVIVFSWSCKAKLRGARLEDLSQEGHALVSRGLLEKAELDEIASLDGSIWQPYHCLDVMRSVVNEGLDESVELRALLIDNSVTELALAIGGSIRVKATGMPHGYDLGLQALVFLYMTLGNFAFAPSCGWFTPVPMLTIFFILWALLAMGTMLIDPFGVDVVDHPLGSFCAAIEQQCNAVHERNGKALHLPPSERAKRTEEAKWGKKLRTCDGTS